MAPLASVFAIRGLRSWVSCLSVSTGISE